MISHSNQRGLGIQLTLLVRDRQGEGLNRSPETSNIRASSELARRQLTNRHPNLGGALPSRARFARDQGRRRSSNFAGNHNDGNGQLSCAASWWRNLFSKTAAD